jgi:hypothetical protein
VGGAAGTVWSVSELSVRARLLQGGLAWFPLEEFWLGLIWDLLAQQTREVVKQVTPASLRTRRDHNPLAAIQGSPSSAARISTIGPTHCAGNATCWLIWASPSLENVTALVEITGPFAQTTLANT